MKREAFVNSALCEGLAAEDIELLLRCGREEEIGQSVEIIAESARNEDLYLILSGRVSIRIFTGISVRQDEIVTLRSSEVFGEIGFLANHRRSASVVTIDDVRVYIFSKHKMANLFESNYRIGYLIMKNLATIIAQRLEDTTLMWATRCATWRNHEG